MKLKQYERQLIREIEQAKDTEDNENAARYHPVRCNCTNYTYSVLHSERYSG